MGKHYSFDTDVAKAVGVDEAIMLENIAYWVDKNRANEHNLYDGCYWTYNSATAFSELFPFWTPKQVRRILGNLTKEYIQIGNYNKSPYDRTRWYSLTPKGVEIIFGAEKIKAFFPSGIPKGEFSKFPNGNVGDQEREHQSHETVTPIPNIKPDTKLTDVNEGQFPFRENSQAPSPKSAAKKPRNIVPPTLEMVSTYIHESCYNVNPQRFMDYYDSTGWCIGKKKMKDWQAAVRNWHNRSKEEGISSRSQQSENAEGAKAILRQMHSWEEDLENG